MKFYIRAFFLLYIICNIITAQEKALHRISVELNGGTTFATSKINQDEDINRGGFTGTIRVMWEPEYFLKIGIEGDILSLANKLEGNKSGIKVFNSLKVTPVMLNFTMKIWEAELLLGMGAAFVNSEISAFNDVSASSAVTTVRMYGAGYSYSLSDRISLGGEVKIFTLAIPELTVATWQLKVKYSLFIW